MKLPHRRKFLRLAACATALRFAPHVARAQAYPTRPVRIIVGFTARGTTDILGRLIGRTLSERMGQQFVVRTWWAREALLPPRLSLARHPMVTHCFLPARLTR